MEPGRKTLNNRGKLNLLLNFLVLAIFVGFCYAKYSGDGASGDDLSSSYVGCRLVGTGQGLEHLYRHDPVDFSAIGPDDAWQDAADSGKFIGYLHPYVQTPLWAYLLRPACMRMGFPSFKNIFVFLVLSSFALSVALIARYWTPSLDNPFALSAALALVFVSQPFHYAMFLVQTHVLFFAMTIAGLILAERGRPGWAGALLAFAAAVKVTPCFILLYWIVAKKGKAASFMGFWLVLFSAVTILFCGLPLFRLYGAELVRISHVLLVSQNNQSLAAWWMTHFYSPDEVFDINIHSLPRGIQLLSTVLVTAFTLLGGVVDRSRRPGALGAAPFGAIIALVAATIFAPIAWTHYSIILIAPVMLFIQAYFDRRSWPIAALVLVVLLLNVGPFASDVVGGEVGQFAVLRSEFFAGVLCLAGLGWLTVKRPRLSRDGGLPQS